MCPRRLAQEKRAARLKRQEAVAAYHEDERIVADALREVREAMPLEPEPSAEGAYNADEAARAYQLREAGTRSPASN